MGHNSMRRQCTNRYFAFVSFLFSDFFRLFFFFAVVNGTRLIFIPLSPTEHTLAQQRNKVEAKLQKTIYVQYKEPFAQLHII